jgi:hypothetical protein
MNKLPSKIASIKIDIPISSNASTGEISGDINPLPNMMPASQLLN